MFSGVETETLKCLARIELNGMSVQKEIIQQLSETLKHLCNTIEKKAFSLAGRHFNFISSTDVSKVIGKFIPKYVIKYYVDRRKGNANKIEHQIKLIDISSFSHYIYVFFFSNNIFLQFDIW